MRQGLKILYVEDDLDIQRALLEILELRGYSVKAASTSRGGPRRLGLGEFSLGDQRLQFARRRWRKDVDPGSRGRPTKMRIADPHRVPRC